MPVRTFLDTGVLIAAAQGTQAAFEAALNVIDDPEREFVGSDFLKLELLPKAVFNQYTDQVEFYTNFFDSLVALIDTNPSVTTPAFDLACKLGLSAGDALHMQAAIALSADEFVTTEKPTKPFFKVQDARLKVTSVYRRPPERSFFSRIKSLLARRLG